ncbi:MAG: acyltransferase [Sphingobium sp.]
MTRTSPSTPRLVPAEPSALRRNNFNTIRIAMALSVVWSHCFALYYGSEASEPLSLLLNGHLNAGEMGVRVFFVISGFLITQSLLHSRSMRDYLAKRVRRVYPGFLAATAVCTFLIVPAFATEGWRLVTPGAVLDWLWRGLTLQELIPPADAFRGNPAQTVNGALWSIRYEFWFYIVLALLGAAGLLARPRWTAALLLGAIACKAGLDLTGRKPGGGALEILIGWPYVWFTMGPYFLAGCAAYFHGRSVPRRAWLPPVLFVALVLSARMGASPILFDMLCPPVLAYALFYIAFAPRRRLPDAARHDDMSYGAYLYGFPVQQMVKALFDLAFPAYVLACLSLSLLAGFLSWHLVEKRFLRRPPPARAAPPPVAVQGA